MNIAAAMSRIYKIEESITADFDNKKHKVQRVYPFFPSTAKMIAGDVAFLNSWELQPTVFASGLLRRTYTISMQLVVKSSDWAYGAQLATAFEDPIVRAFAQDVTLKGEITNIVQMSAQLARIQFSGMAYPGLSIAMDINLSEGMDYAP